MQHCRVDIHKRHARKAANEGHELVQIARAPDGDKAAHHSDGSAKGIFLPLRDPVALTRRSLTEEGSFDDADGGEELHGGADEDGHGVEELHRVDELAGLGVIGDDFDAGLIAEGGVAEGADGGEDEGYDDHDDVEEAGEFLRLRHGGLDGEEQADAFKGEDGGADGKGEVARIEQLNCWV